MNKSDIKSILSQNMDLRDKLFARGFLFTNDNVIENEYPFYGLWKKEKILSYTIMVSPKQTYYIQENNENYLILIGHAYNPFTMEKDENKILKELINIDDSNVFLEKYNELTGIFTLICINEKKVYFFGDPTCMQCVFYTNYNNHIYASTHTNILGDLLSLKWDPFIKELSQYRFFKLFGNALPGNLTQYKEVKRLIPNHYIVYDQNKIINEKRFYYPTRMQKENVEIEKEFENLMHNNLTLIANKWKKPAISMTGGCDSKTTLACANGLYDKFTYFSYISSDSEKVDAEAAHKICTNLGLKHKIYNISKDDKEFENLEATKHLLEWNTGDITAINENDVRKRKFFEDIQDFDIEVKSWASEIGRAYYSKRFNNRKNFGKKATARKCTTLYKVFVHNRKLVKKVDSVFQEYLNNYFSQSKSNPIEWQEQFFWEYRVPSWNGLVITGEHKYSFDITIPYNNRKMLELLLSESLENRINDTLYGNVRNDMNSKIDEMNISVTNLKHTQKRAKIENLYYIIHSKIPF